MSLTIRDEVVPLKTAADGTICVGDTTITLATVVNAFEEGASAAEIIWKYPALCRADLYLVLGYYLRHRREILDYLLEQADAGVLISPAIRTNADMAAIRDRLLARAAKQAAERAQLVAHGAAR
jgi:uncharacterized protein (DUF433 family)